MRSTSRAAGEFQRAGKARTPLMEIGWREWVALPDLNVERIKAKIDTGAKTSALHAYNIQTVERDGTAFAQFVLHPAQRRKSPAVKCLAPIVDKRVIRSSNGVAAERIVISTALRMGDRSWITEISLTNRDEMGFRLLIGRDAIRKGVVILPGRSFLLGK
ncbi:MAG: RimK/LysX family protein [Parvularculaceae bacterium]|nr:ATP-dependent zinc protease [Parvularculaceae bacterium]